MMLTLNGERRLYRRFRYIYFALAAAVALLDQLTKALIVRHVPEHGYISVIPNFFSISHVYNTGAAFSIFADSDSPTPGRLLIAFAFLVSFGIGFFLWKGSPGWQRQGVALALILGGAIGNVVDRITIGAVVDFLAFRLGSYHWPDFNLADSAIVCGALLIALDVFLTRDEPTTPQK